jgi:hypothetical protein
MYLNSLTYAVQHATAYANTLMEAQSPQQVRAVHPDAGCPQKGFVGANTIGHPLLLHMHKCPPVANSIKH